jgi:hypothetical protein
MKCSLVRPSSVARTNITRAIWRCTIAASYTLIIPSDASFTSLRCYHSHTTSNRLCLPLLTTALVTINRRDKTTCIYTTTYETSTVPYNTTTTSSSWVITQYRQCAQSTQEMSTPAPAPSASPANPNAGKKAVHVKVRRECFYRYSWRENCMGLWLGHWVAMVEDFIEAWSSGWKPKIYVDSTWLWY